MMWLIGFNEQVSLIGILRYTRIKEKDGSSTYKKWFEVFGVKKIDPEAAIPLSDSDIQYIQTEMKKPGYYDKLVASFAPHIWGMEAFKEAILLVLASMKLPRPARVLMVTDPSLGKSELIKYTCSLVPGAEHTQMGRSSSAGLTLISEKDEQTGRRYIVRGAAAAAHNNLLCIDEMQMGESMDFMKLNDLLESGKVRYSMAGGRGAMDANCAMLMAANPHEGRFGSDEALGEILKFMGNALPAFISRINLVLMKRDKASNEEEEQIARHMYRHNENDPLYMSRYQENWSDTDHIETTVETPFKGLTITYCTPAERFGTKWIRKIIKYVTKNVRIEPMSPEYEDSLIEYYMQHRMNVVTKSNKLVTKRFLRHGMVLAQYMARLQGQARPDNQDIQRAMELLQKTMSVAAFDPKTGEYDINQFNVNHSQTKLEKDSKMNKTKQFKEAMHKAMLDGEGNNKDYFTMRDIKFACQMLSSKDWQDEDDVEREVIKWANEPPIKLYNKHGEGKYTPLD
jgi:replicative DNA helicase Mcm